MTTFSFFRKRLRFALVFHEFLCQKTRPLLQHVALVSQLEDPYAGTSVLSAIANLLTDSFPESLST